MWYHNGMHLYFRFNAWKGWNLHTVHICFLRFDILHKKVIAVMQSWVDKSGYIHMKYRCSFAEVIYSDKIMITVINKWKIDIRLNRLWYEINTWETVQNDCDINKVMIWFYQYISFCAYISLIHTHTRLCIHMHVHLHTCKIKHMHHLYIHTYVHIHEKLYYLRHAITEI